MKREEAAIMLVRAELSRRLAVLEALPYAKRPADFTFALAELRQMARSYEFAPLVCLAEALSDVLVRAASRRSIDLFLDRMHDAIACDRRDPRAGEALMASISIRRAF